MCSPPSALQRRLELQRLMLALLRSTQIQAQEIFLGNLVRQIEAQKKDEKQQKKRKTRAEMEKDALVKELTLQLLNGKQPTEPVVDGRLRANALRAARRNLELWQAAMQEATQYLARLQSAEVPLAATPQPIPVPLAPAAMQPQPQPIPVPPVAAAPQPISVPLVATQPQPIPVPAPLVAATQQPIADADGDDGLLMPHVARPLTVDWCRWAETLRAVTALIQEGITEADLLAFLTTSLALPEEECAQVLVQIKQQVEAINYHISGYEEPSPLDPSTSDSQANAPCRMCRRTAATSEAGAEWIQCDASGCWLHESCLAQRKGDEALERAKFADHFECPLCEKERLRQEKAQKPVKPKRKAP